MLNSCVVINIHFRQFLYLNVLLFPGYDTDCIDGAVVEGEFVLYADGEVGLLGL